MTFSRESGHGQFFTSPNVLLAFEKVELKEKIGNSETGAVIA